MWEIVMHYREFVSFTFEVDGIRHPSDEDVPLLYKLIHQSEMGTCDTTDGLKVMNFERESSSEFENLSKDANQIDWDLTIDVSEGLTYGDQVKEENEDTILANSKVAAALNLMDPNTRVGIISELQELMGFLDERILQIEKETKSGVDIRFSDFIESQEYFHLLKDITDLDRMLAFCKECVEELNDSKLQNLLLLRTSSMYVLL
jgi:hypothetical protein